VLGELTQKILLLINLGEGAYNPRNPPFAYGPVFYNMFHAIAMGQITRQLLAKKEYKTHITDLDELKHD